MCQDQDFNLEVIRQLQQERFYQEHSVRYIYRMGGRSFHTVYNVRDTQDPTPVSEPDKLSNSQPKMKKKINYGRIFAAELLYI